MGCPACRGEKLSVVDSRKTVNSIRRRRKCLGCGYRFTTFELSDSAAARFEELDALDHMVSRLSPHDRQVLQATVKAMLENDN